MEAVEVPLRRGDLAEERGEKAYFCEGTIWGRERLLPERTTPHGKKYLNKKED